MTSIDSQKTCATMGDEVIVGKSMGAYDRFVGLVFSIYRCVIPCSSQLSTQTLIQGMADMMEWAMQMASLYGAPSGWKGAVFHTCFHTFFFLLRLDTVFFSRALLSKITFKRFSRTISHFIVASCNPSSLPKRRRCHQGWQGL